MCPENYLMMASPGERFVLVSYCFLVSFFVLVSFWFCFFLFGFGFFLVFVSF